MPKTSVYKDDLSSARECQVGMTREITAMETVAIAHPVNNAPDHHLRLRVLAPNQRHLGTAGGVYLVAHGELFVMASTCDRYIRSSL
jgi:hypothetical protein